MAGTIPASPSTVSVVSPTLAGPVAKIAARGALELPLRQLKGKADPAVVRTIEDLYRRVTDLHESTTTVAQGLATAVAPSVAPPLASVQGAAGVAVATSLAAGVSTGSVVTGPAGPPGPPGPPGPAGLGMIFDDEDADGDEDDWLLALGG